MLFIETWIIIFGESNGWEVKKDIHYETIEITEKQTPSMSNKNKEGTELLM